MSDASSFPKEGVPPLREPSMPVAQLLRAPKEVSATENAFRQALRDFGVVLFDENQLADVIVGVLPRAENQQKYNLDVIVNVLSQELSNQRNKKINWKAVVSYFDCGNNAVRSMDDFQLLARFFQKISGVKFPASGLMGNWSNRGAQLYMLILAANCPRQELVDFTDMVSVKQQIRDAPVPPNLSYMCLPLYESLLGLASRGMRVQVLKTLIAASELYPEYVTILLAQANDPTTPSVRGEVLARCLQKFSGLPGSRPTYMAVMQALLAVNKDLLVWLFRTSLKRAPTSQEVVDVKGMMQSMGEQIVRRVEEEGTPDELVRLWCINSDTAGFNLDAKVRDILDSQPGAAKPLAVFLRTYGPKLRPKNQHGSILSIDAFNIILGALSRYMQGKFVQSKEVDDSNSTFVSGEEIRELREFGDRYRRDAVVNQTRMRPGHMLHGAPEVPKRELQSGTVDSSKLEFDDIERAADMNFQKIYSKELSVVNGIQLLKRLKMSSDQKDQDIFRCMIHNFFDEYRFFQNYPEPELRLTGMLFGMLIQHQLVSSITLGIGLRYVLESVRRDPVGGAAFAKLFQIFGVTALEQFRGRLGEWPQYCSHLLQIPHFSRYCPQLYQDVQSAMNNQPVSSLVDASGADSSFDIPGKSQQSQVVPGNGLSTALGNIHLDSAVPSAGKQIVSTESVNVVAVPIQVKVNAPRPMLMRLEKPSVISSMIAANKDPATNVTLPPENIQDEIYRILNNVANSNVEAKCAQLQKLLAPEYNTWFANYLVSKRISTQPNYLALYLNIIDLINSRHLNAALLNCTYFHVTNLLQSPTITTSSSERSLLRNLGMWLGQVTLARNKPILQTRLHPKELLFWGFETGRLIAVCSFVAKILEGVREATCVVFRPPNPWLMPLLGVLRDIYDTEDLKTNIKFEVQSLLQRINIRIEDIPKANMIGHCRMPVKDGTNPDFNIKSAPAPAQNLPPTPPATAPATQAETSSELNIAAEQAVIPNLASYVTINPSLQLFVSDPSRRRLVYVAVDKAIREVIQPVMERSALISCRTTKQVVLKDYASEPNEIQLRAAAHSMVSSIAGSLAVATSKELLRTSIAKNLRVSISAFPSEQPIDQVVLTCSNDNVDLGCAVIKKAAIEKAIRDIDEQLSGAYQARRKAREADKPFYDADYRDEVAMKYLAMLPDALKMTQGALPTQLALYEEFRRQRPVAATTGPNMSANEANPDQGAVLAQAQAQAPQSMVGLSMQQALEAYQAVIVRLDAALLKLNVQLQGREVTMAMLGGDHEVLALLQEIIIITKRSQASIRVDAALSFAENIFKRLIEAPDVTDTLRLDVMVGGLEGLRDACGGAKKFVPDVSAWLSRYSSAVMNDEMNRKVHRAVLMRLMRVELLRPQEVDIYFAAFMDEGRNIKWVDQALNFVQLCIADGLAQTYEFATIFETVSKMRSGNPAVRQMLSKWLSDMKQKQPVGFPPTAVVPDAQIPPTPQGMQGQTPQVTGSLAAGGPTTVIAAAANGANVATVRNGTPEREHVTVLLESWLRVWTSTNDQAFGQYLHLMNQFGVLKTEAAADRFFRIATELCVEACLKSGQAAAPNALKEGIAVPKTQLVFTVIDALAKLFILLMRLTDKEAGSPQLLTRILNTVVRTLIDDHDGRIVSKTLFDQRPYFRLLANLSQDIGLPHPQKEPSQKVLQVLGIFSSMYSQWIPLQRVPGFAFAWLQLVTHRCFMPHLLLVKNQKGWPHMHRLLHSLLVFLKPYLKSAQMNEAIRKLYTGMLRVLLVLLHDFPEFLSDYHVSFCDAIPETCVQLRNIILSAYSKSVRLPEPSSNSLKLDAVLEMKIPPRILTDDEFNRELGNVRPRLDKYLLTKQPVDFPVLLAAALVSGGEYNVTLISVLTLYVGAKGAETQNVVPLQSTPSTEIFKYLVRTFNPQGRYHLLNAVANQLRYPNSHTLYFSQLLLTLFLEAGDFVYVQEQITRVLLERILVKKPHPWGLLVTFFELLKNPIYAFWTRPFTKCAPEIEKIFADVRDKIVGPSSASSAKVAGAV